MVGFKPRKEGPERKEMSWNIKDNAYETTAWQDDVQRLLQEVDALKVGAEFVSEPNLDKVVEPEVHHTHGGSYYEPYELYYTPPTMLEDIADDHAVRRYLTPVIVAEVELNKDRSRVVHEGSCTRYGNHTLIVLTPSISRHNPIA